MNQLFDNTSLVIPLGFDPFGLSVIMSFRFGSACITVIISKCRYIPFPSMQTYQYNSWYNLLAGKMT